MFVSGSIGPEEVKGEREREVYARRCSKSFSDRAIAAGMDRNPSSLENRNTLQRTLEASSKRNKNNTRVILSLLCQKSEGKFQHMRRHHIYMCSGSFNWSIESVMGNRDGELKLPSTKSSAMAGCSYQIPCCCVHWRLRAFPVPIPELLVNSWNRTRAL